MMMMMMMITLRTALTQGVGRGSSHLLAAVGLVVQATTEYRLAKINRLQIDKDK